MIMARTNSLLAMLTLVGCAATGQPPPTATTAPPAAATQAQIATDKRAMVGQMLAGEWVNPNASSRFRTTAFGQDGNGTLRITGGTTDRLVLASVSDDGRQIEFKERDVGEEHIDYRCEVVERSGTAATGLRCQAQPISTPRRSTLGLRRA